MQVRDRCPRRPPLVLEEADVRRRGPQGPIAIEHHGHGARGVLRAQAVEGVVVPRALDDHLVMFPCRELVGKDPHPPWVAVARDLRRRLRLRAGTEGAGRLVVDERALVALRRQDDRIAGDGRLADHERSSLRASAPRWAMPRRPKATSSAAIHSAMVNGPSVRPSQPLLKRMCETMGKTISARTNSPRPTDS